jgi:hypothetical protein
MCHKLNRTEHTEAIRKKIEDNGKPTNKKNSGESKKINRRARRR